MHWRRGLQRGMAEEGNGPRRRRRKDLEIGPICRCHTATEGATSQLALLGRPGHFPLHTGWQPRQCKGLAGRHGFGTRRLPVLAPSQAGPGALRCPALPPALGRAVRFVPPPDSALTLPETPSQTRPEVLFSQLSSQVAEHSQGDTKLTVGAEADYVHFPSCQGIFYQDRCSGLRFKTVTVAPYQGQSRGSCFLSCTREP